MSVPADTEEHVSGTPRIWIHSSLHFTKVPKNKSILHQASYAWSFPLLYLITQVVSLAYGLMSFLKQRRGDHSHGNPECRNFVIGTTPAPSFPHDPREATDKSCNLRFAYLFTVSYILQYIHKGWGDGKTSFNQINKSISLHLRKVPGQKEYS